MKSRTTDRFQKLLADLPEQIRRLARDVYEKFEKDPYYPSLHFKRVHSTRPIYSVRISIDYRALGIVDNNDIIWFWIGSHSDYDKLLKKI